MVIEYRNYLPGDEKDLATVFNYAFQGLGGGFLRTPRNVKWRYIHRPHGDPKEIQIAFDIDQKKIVGAIYSTIETYWFQGHQFKVGAINDVSTLPECTGKGVAKKLMQLAIEFMESQDCDYSILAADPKGFPRSKIYVPSGYQDYAKQNAWFNFANPITLLQYVPAVFPLEPALFMGKAIRSLFARRKILNLQSSGISTKIIHTNQHPLSLSLNKEYWNFYLEHGKKMYNGFSPLDWEEWQYFRMHPNQTGLKPSFIEIRYQNQLIGLASLSRQWIYASKFGIHLPMGWLREFVLDSSGEIPRKYLDDISFGLSHSLNQAAIQRGCAVLIGFFTNPPYYLNRALRLSGFIDSHSGGAYMIKSMKNNQLPPKSKKMLFASPGDMILSP